MDFLNKAFAQVVDLFRSMTPGARLTAGLLLIVVIISLGYLFTHDISGPSADLMQGMSISPGLLPAMEAAFGKAKLTGYKIDGMRIRVPRGQEAVYMAALADAKVLPANFDTIIDDDSGNGSYFETEKDREQRRKNVKQKKLSLFISAMNGIERATVIYDSDTKGGLNREKILTASVAVKPTGSEHLDAETVSKIRHFVAGAIAGLKPENVTVSDSNGRTWYGNPENGGGADDNIYVSLKRTYEQDLRAKILNALSYIPNVTVEPTVTLDTTKNSRMHEVKRDTKTTTVHELSTSTSRTQDSGGTSGRPGYAGQQPNTSAVLGANSAGGSKEEEEQSKSEVFSVPSGSETETEKVGLTPKMAKVSIGIPVSYFKSVWRERNPAKDAKEQKEPDQAALDQIRTEVTETVRKHVAPLLPQVEGVADLTEYVTVSTFQDIPGKEIPGPSTSQSALAWLGEYWNVLGMIGVALASLLMLRSLIRSVPISVASEPVAALKIAAAPVGEKQSPEPAPSSVHRLRRFTGGPSLIDELSEMVKEDPDTAANILRGWIGSPSP
jgi:flagellar M-ring protein FliF